MKIVDNAGDVPKDLIVEQLLTSNPETGEPIPVVDDDGDQLWVDFTAAYKMVIVINMGLKMGIGKIAAQVSDEYSCNSLSYQKITENYNNYQNTKHD